MSEPAAPIRTERLGIAAVVAATCIWATGTVIVKGSTLAFLNIFTWTGYWFFSRRARRTAGPIEYFACVMIAGAVVLTPIAFVLDGVPAWPTSAEWASVWAVALFPGFVGHTLMIWSHNHVESWRSALITQATPVISTILAWIFLGEVVTPIVAAGGAVVIGCTSAVIVHAARRADDLDDTVESPG